MWLILISLTLHFVRHGIILPFIPLLAEQMGAGPTTIGFIVGSFSLVAVFLSIPLGGLVDRSGVKRLLDTFNRNKILAVSMLAIIIAVGLLPAVASVIEFAILISLLGLGFGMTQPLSMVMIADLTDPVQSGLAIGLRFTAIMLAGLLSPIFLGLIIETMGVTPAFYVAALVVALAGIRMFIIGPDLIPGRRL